MKAFRFTTRISDSGLIQIPDNPSLHDKEVEIIIMVKQKTLNKKMKASHFVEKWAGFISEVDVQNSKLDYLTKKYE